MRYVLHSWGDGGGPRRSVVVQVEDLPDMGQIDELTDAVVMNIMEHVRTMWDGRDLPMSRFYVPTVEMFNNPKSRGARGDILKMPMNMVPRRDGADFYVIDRMFFDLVDKFKAIVEGWVDEARLQQEAAVLA